MHHMLFWNKWCAFDRNDSIDSGSPLCPWNVGTCATDETLPRFSFFLAVLEPDHAVASVIPSEQGMASWVGDSHSQLLCPRPPSCTWPACQSLEWTSPPKLFWACTCSFTCKHCYMVKGTGFVSLALLPAQWLPHFWSCCFFSEHLRLSHCPFTGHVRCPSILQKP